MKKLCLMWILCVALPSWASDKELTADPRVATALGLLEAWVDAEAVYKDIPGVSVAVVHDQMLLWSQGFGFADREQKKRATPETMYSICSISKLFTSISVLQLRDRGELQLDDPAARHLPWFDIQQSYEDAPPITVRGLLTHSAGLPRETDHSYWTYPEFEFPEREDVIERLSRQSTLYPEGRYFQYSNLGLTLAGEIVAQLSGMPYDAYVKQHILMPLGLSDTFPELPAEHRGGRFATGYGGKRREGGREIIKFFQAKGVAPAAGFASTVEDLAKFASWQFRLLDKGGTEILRAGTLREMQRVQWTDPDWKLTWGLGFSVRRRDDKTFVGHGGGCPGFRSDLLLQRKEKIATVVMTNAMDANAGAFTRTAYSIVAPAIKEALDAPEKGKAMDPAFEMYTGTYLGGWGGELVVLPWKDSLGFVFLPTDNPADELIPLKHDEGHRFRRVRKDGELGEAIVFAVEDGQVVHMTRHNNHSRKIH